VVVVSRDRLVGALEDRQRWHDVQQGHTFDARRVVKRHAVGDAGTAIVPHDLELLMAERRHRRDLILSHGALRIGGMIAGVWWLAAVAIAAQVGGDDCEALRQARRDPMPHHMTLREAMEQQQRRPASPVTRWISAPLVTTRRSAKPSNMSVASFARPLQGGLRSIPSPSCGEPLGSVRF
jgi:hypothetical protein